MLNMFYNCLYRPCQRSCGPTTSADHREPSCFSLLATPCLVATNYFHIQFWFKWDIIKRKTIGLGHLASSSDFIFHQLAGKTLYLDFHRLSTKADWHFPLLMSKCSSQCSFLYVLWCRLIFSCGSLWEDCHNFHLTAQTYESTIKAHLHKMHIKYISIYLYLHHILSFFFIISAPVICIFSICNKSHLCAVFTCVLLLCKYSSP